MPRLCEQDGSTFSLPSEQLTSETPRVVLQRLHILNINNEHVARLGSFDLEGSGEVVDFGQIDVANIVCRIIVLDLAARPVDTLNLYSLSVLDRPSERNC
jgi:hypothetical protein